MSRRDEDDALVGRCLRLPELGALAAGDFRISRPEIQPAVLVIHLAVPMEWIDSHSIAHAARTVCHLASPRYDIVQLAIGPGIPAEWLDQAAQPESYTIFPDVPLQLVASEQLHTLTAWLNNEARRGAAVALMDVVLRWRRYIDAELACRGPSDFGYRWPLRVALDELQATIGAPDDPHILEQRLWMLREDHRITHGGEQRSRCDLCAFEAWRRWESTAQRAVRASETEPSVEPD